MAATGPHGIFFQKAQSRHGFSGVHDADREVGDNIHQFSGLCGNAGQSLDKIQSYTFAGENRLGRALNLRQDITGLYSTSFINPDGDQQ